MKISTKGRYGLRAIVDLVAHSDGEHVALKSIAERQGISENYLEQVFSALRKANVIKSVKGAQGGYSLAMPSTMLTVGAVLKVLEGSLAVHDEQDEVYETGTIQSTLFNHVWHVMNVTIDEVIEKITIDDLVKDYQKNSGQGNMMFYI